MKNTIKTSCSEKVCERSSLLIVRDRTCTRDSNIYSSLKRKREQNKMSRPQVDLLFCSPSSVMNMFESRVQVRSLTSLEFLEGLLFCDVYMQRARSERV
jgi:hypothetical protein